MMYVVVSLSDGLHKVHGLEGRKSLLEIRQKIITNHMLSNTEICIDSLTRSGLDEAEAANAGYGDERSDGEAQNNPAN